MRLVLALIFFCGVMGMAQVVTEFDPNEPLGKRPYEMEWAGRKEPRPPTVTFADLRGWRMEVSGNAQAIFRPSREQNVWDRPVGKLVYKGSGDPNSRPTILLYPPNPIPIPDGSDCVEGWIYGNRWGWENPPDTPPVQIFIHLQDEKGQRQRVHFATVNWKEWWLVHRRLFPMPQGGKTKGWQFVALEISGGWQPQERTLYFDSLTFYAEPLPPLKFPPRPRRNLTLFDGQSPGLNTGRGKLEFPTREETILPVNLTKQFRTEVRQEGNSFVFTYTGNDCTVTYRFDPSQGLSGIYAVVHKGKVATKSFQLMAEGGIKFADGGNEGKLVRSELRSGVVIAEYERGVTYRLRLWQKSLVIDAICLGGQATELSFGEIRILDNHTLHSELRTEHRTLHSALRTIYVPFITYGGNSNPVVTMWHSANREGEAPAEPSILFISIWLDWYRSNGSEPFAFPEGQWTPTGLRINGGVRYHPKTDGKRNDLFERVFVTVSPNFEEVLPVIPNPKGLHAHLAVDRLWQETWGPADYEREMERSRRLRAYGITKLIQCNHEITWRDGGESFTLRTRAAPGKGGDEALKRYLAHQKSLGWFAGLYTNYCDFAPVNEHWNPDYVQRTPDGNWRPAWPRCYALKPAAAVMFHEKLAPIIKSKFHEGGQGAGGKGQAGEKRRSGEWEKRGNGEAEKNGEAGKGGVSAYTDVHTAVAPWHYCDYDARVPGAGTFAQTFYCYGELLRNDSRIYGGPIFSEGTFQWLYAGLADGNYALTYNNRPIAKEPLLPIFYLREIHTKECGIGMAWTDWFLQGVPDWQKDVDKAIDRFLLHTIAYGNIGWLVEERFGMERVCRSYYMLQRLQARYGLLPPTQVAYFDGKKLVGVSEALALDLPRARRQLFIAYPNGLRIWLNDWDKETTDEAIWRVEVDGKVYEIPPAGWLAVQGKEFLTFSALVDGRKVDFLRDAKGYGDEPPLLYADGRGEWVRFGEVATKGAIAVRRIGERQVEVLDISRTGEFGLKNPLGVEGVPVKCEVFDINGKPLGETEIRLTADYAWVIGKPEGHRYVVTFEGKAKVSWHISAETHYAPPGAKLPLKVVGAPAREMRISCEGAKVDGQTIIIPESAAVGSRVWVRADWQGETRWWDFTVVPIVRWQVNLQPVGDGRAEIKLRPKWFLDGLEGEQVIIALEPPSWLTVNPLQWKFERKNLPDQLTAKLVTDAPVGTEGTIRIVTVIGERRHEAQIRLSVAQEPRAILRLDKIQVPFSWGICRRGGREQTDDGKSGATFHRSEAMPVGGVRKDGFFSHPPYIGGVGYVWAQFGPITLPEEPCVFRVWVGLMDGGDPSDGALFVVEVLDEQGKLHRLAEKLGVQKEWRELVADLTEFAGKKVWLRLIADVGPNDNSTADWASWGEPRIELKTPKRILQAR
jgi:hypothetical protein